MADETRPKRRVAVLGGGPSGLSAAYTLTHGTTPVHVDVFEAAPNFGGALISENAGGYTYDLGPNSMNAKHPAVYHLLHNRLNITSRIMPRQGSKRVLILKQGKLLPLPMSPMAFLRSGLLSWRAKLRILGEPFVPRLNDEAQSARESVERFFTRRFGREAVDYVIDPALAGIYSASPARLSMKHAFSKLWKLEQQCGSVILGLLRGGARPPPDERFPNYSASQLLRSFSYDDGMQTLTMALEQDLQQQATPCKLLRNAKVHSLQRDGKGKWHVNGRGPYDAVITTMPAHALSQVRSSNTAVDRGFDKLSEQVQYAPVSVVVLAFDKAQIPKSAVGFGALTPSLSGRKMMGVNFSSAGYPQRLSEKDRVFWTVYLGGHRHPEVPFLNSDAIVDLSVRELQEVFGVKGEPVFSRVKIWAKGIPTYNLNYDSAQCTMGRVERRAPGLVFGGNYVGGVGVPDALLSGMTAAERVDKYLGTL